MSIKTRTTVVIVGGGISGVKAALELQKNGIDYLLLEAKEKLGGRLNTVQGKHGKYDLGASWFHETLNNDLFDEEISLLGSKDDPIHFYDDAPVKILNQYGPVSNLLKLQPIVEEIFKSIEIGNYDDLGKDKSVHDSIIEYLKSRKHLLSHEQIINGYEYARSLELWHGVDIKRMSSKYYSIDNEGRDAMALNYDRVLKRHVSQLKSNNVILNSVVESIERIEKGNNVKITTQNGEEIIANFTIVTVPQSILQLNPTDEGFIHFNPPLPEKLQKSLSSIHFGALGKVVLEFETVFWPLDSERAFVLGTPPDGFLEAILSQDKTIPSYVSTDVGKRSWQYPILFLNLATSLQKPTLIALTQSPVTEYLESNPTKSWDFLKPAIAVLANKSKSELPSPINQLNSNWTVDGYQRGSYSACFPGDDPLEPIIAFEQGFGNVRFAGEHTILEGAGCVHGAWSSGIREAKYIIEELQQK